MVRVLHLIAEEADFQTRRSIDALVRDAGPEFQITVRTVGRGAAARGAAGAVTGLRREPAAPHALVHAWGIRALTIAALGGRGPILFSPTRFLGRRSVGWLRAVIGYRDVHIVCPTATQRRFCVEHGVPLERCHLVRPGVEFARVRRRRDPDVRRRLGFGDDDHVVLAPGESTRAAAHEDAVWSMAIAHFLDPRCKLLMWGRGSRSAAAERRARRMTGTAMLGVAEPALGTLLEFEDLLPAADSVLITARGPVATLPIAVCMAAALPIVSTVTYTVAELLEDRHTAVMVPRPVPRLIARKLLDLRDDTGTQWSVADMARTEAYEYFSLTRFVDQFRTAYRQVAARTKVDIPEPAPGAGRRFHQRA
jgi:glycosyltransferase involved in cell wall biosynthesis